jgi:predicted nucleic acid-binding protein
MWVFDETLASSAEALSEGWVRDGLQIVAPTIFTSEVTSIVRERNFRGAISAQDARDSLELTFQWPVSTPDLGIDQQRRALQIAARFNQPKAYDAQYLAFADLLGCELWTGDRRLVNQVSRELPWVKWVGDYRPA